MKTDRRMAWDLVSVKATNFGKYIGIGKVMKKKYPEPTGNAHVCQG